MKSNEEISAYLTSYGTENRDKLYRQIFIFIYLLLITIINFETIYTVI